MTMSAVQALVPISEPIETTSSAEPGFPAALKDASRGRGDAQPSSEEGSVERSRSHPSHGKERSEARRDSRGPEHATGLERAAEMTSKEFVNSHHGEVTDTSALTEGDSEELESLLAAVELPIQLPLLGEAETLSEAEVPPVEILEDVVVVPAESGLVTFEPVLEELASETQAIAVLDSVRSEPGAEHAVVAIVTDDPEIEPPETESGVANQESRTPAIGLTKEAEVDLEVLSQFLGTVPQSLEVKTEPLELLLSEGDLRTKPVPQIEQVQAQATSTVPLESDSDTEDALVLKPVTPPAHLAPQVADAAPQVAAVAKVVATENAVEHFVASGAEVSVQAAESGSPVVAAADHSNPQVLRSETSETARASETVSAALPNQASDSAQEHSFRGSGDSSSSSFTEEGSAPKEVASSQVESPAKPNGTFSQNSRSEIGEPLSRALVRLVERIEVLRNAPPPRTMILELSELEGARVRVSLEGDSVKMTIMGGSMNSDEREQLDRELGQALSQRGFDLAGDNKERNEREEEIEDQTSFSSPRTPRLSNRSASELRI